MTVSYRRSAGRRARIPVEIRALPMGDFALKCPTCQRWGRLRKERHRVTVHLDETVSISEPVLCPNRLCGWFVRICHGIARDAKERERRERADFPILTLLFETVDDDTGSENRGLFSGVELRGFPPRHGRSRGLH